VTAKLAVGVKACGACVPGFLWQ